ncbi:hypothetical protein IWZ00DRAFT_530439 [Phyllosticta capitalensis]
MMDWSLTEGSEAPEFEIDEAKWVRAVMNSIKMPPEARPKRFRDNEQALRWVMDNSRAAGICIPLFSGMHSDFASPQIYHEATRQMERHGLITWSPVQEEVRPARQQDFVASQPYAQPSHQRQLLAFQGPTAAMQNGPWYPEMATCEEIRHHERHCSIQHQCRPSSGPLAPGAHHDERGPQGKPLPRSQLLKTTVTAYGASFTHLGPESGFPTAGGQSLQYGSELMPMLIDSDSDDDIDSDVGTLGEEPSSLPFFSERGNAPQMATEMQMPFVEINSGSYNRYYRYPDGVIVQGSQPSILLGEGPHSRKSFKIRKSDGCANGNGLLWHPSLVNDALLRNRIRNCLDQAIVGKKIQGGNRWIPLQYFKRLATDLGVYHEVARLVYHYEHQFVPRLGRASRHVPLVDNPEATRRKEPAATTWKPVEKPETVPIPAAQADPRPTPAPGVYHKVARLFDHYEHQIAPRVGLASKHVPLLNTPESTPTAEPSETRPTSIEQPETRPSPVLQPESRPTPVLHLETNPSPVPQPEPERLPTPVHRPETRKTPVPQPASRKTPVPQPEPETRPTPRPEPRTKLTPGLAPGTRSCGHCSNAIGTSFEDFERHLAACEKAESTQGLRGVWVCACLASFPSRNHIERHIILNDAHLHRKSFYFNNVA